MHFYFFLSVFLDYRILSSWNGPRIQWINTLPNHKTQNLQVDLVLGHHSKLPWTLLDLQLDIQTKTSKITTAFDNICQRNKEINYDTFKRRSHFFSWLQTDYLQQTSDLFLPLYSISSPHLGCSIYFMSPFSSPLLSPHVSIPFH